MSAIAAAIIGWRWIRFVASSRSATSNQKR
jgi:hypothetical protein